MAHESTTDTGPAAEGSPTGRSAAVRKTGLAVLAAALIIVGVLLIPLGIIPSLYQHRQLRVFSKAFAQLPDSPGSAEVASAASIPQAKSVWTPYMVGELRTSGDDPATIEAYYTSAEYADAFNGIFDVDPSLGALRGGVRRMSIQLRFFEPGSCAERSATCPRRLQADAALLGDAVTALTCPEALCFFGLDSVESEETIYAVFFTHTGRSFWDHQFPTKW